MCIGWYNNMQLVSITQIMAPKLLLGKVCNHSTFGLELLSTWTKSQVHEYIKALGDHLNFELREIDIQCCNRWGLKA